MRNNGKKLVRLLVAALLALAMTLPLTACQVEIPGMGTININDGASDGDTAKTNGGEPGAYDDSLDLLRQLLDERQQDERLAVAYIGDIDGSLSDLAVPLRDWIDDTAPGLCAQYTFVRNIPQERVVGDGGSLLLGFCLSYFLLKLGMDNRAILPYDPNALFYGITLLFLPTADLARVALERLRQRQPIFQADKRHIHHRLMGAGLTMHQTLLVILGLEVLFCIVNYFCINCLEMGATLTLLLDILIFAFFNLVLMRSQKA